MDEESIDGLPALLIRGEAFIDKLALISSHLRSAIRVNEFHVDDSIRIIFYRRSHISNCSEPQSRDRRIFAFVRELVRLAGLEAALHGQPVRIKRDLTIFHAAKLPVISRNETRCSNPALTHS